MEITSEEDIRTYFKNAAYRSAYGHYSKPKTVRPEDVEQYNQNQYLH